MTRKISKNKFILIVIVLITATASGYYYHLATWEPLLLSVIVYDRDNEDKGDRLVFRDERQTYTHPSMIKNRELDDAELTDKSYLNGECFVLTIRNGVVEFADTYEDRITYFGPSPYYRKLPINEIETNQPIEMSKGYVYFSPRLPSETILFVFRLEHNNKVYTLLSPPGDRPEVATLKRSKYLTVIIDIHKDNVIELHKSQHEKSIRDLLGDLL